MQHSQDVGFRSLQGLYYNSYDWKSYVEPTWDGTLEN
jgi:hypothetical protein